jgi:hypothetical protein
MLLKPSTEKELSHFSDAMQSCDKSYWAKAGKTTHLTISAQRTRTELELGFVMKRTVCGDDSHFSKI